jgi:hypothetical protein
MFGWGRGGGTVGSPGKESTRGGFGWDGGGDGCGTGMGTRSCPKAVTGDAITPQNKASRCRRSIDSSPFKKLQGIKNIAKAGTKAR